MADCEVAFKVAPSGTGFVALAINPADGKPSDITNVVDGNETDSVIITGRPAGDVFTFTHEGQTTADIPLHLGPPAGFGQWNVTDLTPGTYDLAFDTGGGTAHTLVMEILDDGVRIGTFTFDYAGTPGGATHPTPFADLTSPTPINQFGHSGAQDTGIVQWFPIGRFTFASSNLSVRCSCELGADFFVDCLRYATTDGVTVNRTSTVHPPFTFASGGQLFGFDDATWACWDSHIAFQLVGSGAGSVWVCDPADAASAVGALSNVGAGNAEAIGQGSAFAPLLVSFSGALGGLPFPVMTASPTSGPGSVAVTRHAPGGVLPAFTIDRPGVGIIGPVQLQRDWLSWTKRKKVMPTCRFALPQYLPAAFKYAIPGHRDNVFDLESHWKTLYDRFSEDDPGAGLSGYTAQTRHAVGIGPALNYVYRMTPPGQYRVSITWPSHAGLSTDVIYTLVDADGNILAAPHIDQTVEPDGAVDGGRPWHVLGTFTLGRSVNAGHMNGFIINQTNGTSLVMVADAARFERVSDDDSIQVLPGDTVTFSAGGAWMTCVAGDAPAATDVDVENLSGETLYDATKHAEPTTIRMGWNIPHLLTDGTPFYSNRLYNNNVLDQYPTQIAGSVGSFNVCDAAAPIQGDLKDAPNLRAGDYDLLWKGDSELDLVNSIPDGFTAIPARTIFPGVDANGYHRKTTTLKAWPFSYGSRAVVNIHGTTIVGSGPLWNCDFHDVWVVPRDTDVTTAPKFHPTFTSNTSNCKTFRWLDPLAAIQGNCTDFADYECPAGKIDRQLKSRRVFRDLSGTTIKQYEYNPAEFPHPFETTFGVMLEIDFPGGHAMEDGQFFDIQNYTGDNPLFSDGVTPQERFLGGRYDAYPIDANRVVIRYFLGFFDQSAFRMMNTITNADGNTFQEIGAVTPIADVVEFHNLQGADLFWNTHFANTDDCLFQCGQYIGENLAAGLKLRVECSNEVWNGQNTPGIYAENASGVFYGVYGQTYVPYYCNKLKQHHDQMKAGWVAAGRDPADFRRIVGSQMYGAGHTSTIVEYMHARGWTFDELVIANYMGSYPSAATEYGGDDADYQFYRQADAWTVEQHLDVMEEHRVYGKYELEVPLHRNALDAHPEFADVEIGFYEGGPDLLIYSARTQAQPGPYGSPNFGYINHAMQRHPRMYGILLEVYRIAQDSGCKYANVFMYQGGDTINQVAWGAYRAEGWVPYVPGNPTQDAIQIDQVERTDIQQCITGGAVYNLASRFDADPGPDFTIAVTGPATLAQGGSVTWTVTLTPLAGFTGTAALTLGSLPSGVTADPFSPTSLTGGGTMVATFVLHASGSATTGGATVTVTGTDSTDSLTHLGNKTLTVTSAGGSLAAGTATAGSSTSTTASASASDASGGTSPYTYQWYRSTSSGTLGSAVSGQTTRTLADSGLTASTTYYYTLRYTDSASAHVDSNQVAVSTTSGASPTGPILFRNLRVV